MPKVDIDFYNQNILGPQSWVSYTPRFSLDLTSALDKRSSDSYTGVDYDSVNLVLGSNSIERAFAFVEGSPMHALLTAIRHKIAFPLCIILGGFCGYSGIVIGGEVGWLYSIPWIIGFVLVIALYKFLSREPKRHKTVNVIDNPYMSRFAQWTYANADDRADVLWDIYRFCASMAADGYEKVRQKFNIGSASYAEIDMVYSRGIEYLSRVSYEILDARVHYHTPHIPPIPTAAKIAAGATSDRAWECAYRMEEMFLLNVPIWTKQG